MHTHIHTGDGTFTHTRLRNQTISILLQCPVLTIWVLSVRVALWSLSRWIGLCSIWNQEHRIWTMRQRRQSGIQVGWRGWADTPRGGDAWLVLRRCASGNAVTSCSHGLTLALRPPFGCSTGHLGPHIREKKWGIYFILEYLDKSSPSFIFGSCHLASYLYSCWGVGRVKKGFFNPV